MRSAPQITAPSRAEQARRGLAGRSCVAEICLQYSSRVVHHLSQLCPDPFGFHLDRLLPEREAVLSRGASIPFGGCSRMCLRNRVGAYELRVVIDGR